MVKENEGFTHITVNAADDDEVIVAGVGREAPEAATVQTHTEVSQAAPAQAQAVEPQAAPAQAQRAAAPQQASGAVTRKAKKDEYHETTLEDLQSGGMSTMQKAIIAAALICIIGALVYYFVAMR